jgi:ribonucleoside-diphosphate reductase alpha chain
MSISVIKRNGVREELNIGKIQKQVQYACEGISEVSQSTVELTAQLQFFDGMTTDMIDKTLLRAMINLIDVTQNPEISNVNYQYVAGRHRVAMLRKEVYNCYCPPRLYEIVKKNVEAGVYTSELLEWYTEAEWEMMDLMIDHSKDEEYAYAAIDQLIEKYLVRNRVTNQIYETPQVRYIVAAATAFNADGKGSQRLSLIRDYYKYASDGAFTLATPVLAGLGTPTKQFSSCVLIEVGDSLSSIFASGEMMAKYAAARAGIGLGVGGIRSLGSEIRRGEVRHTGLVPFLKKFFSDLKCVAQGGIRGASCTNWFPLFHYQFDDMIVLKNNQGTEETRIRHMDYGVVMSKFFWKRFKDKGNITFFDPKDVPDLFEAFYQNVTEFEKLYCKYERNIKLRKKVISAEIVFKDWLLKERTDTGRIYLMYVDNIISHTPFDVRTHSIKQLNLCAEIALPTKPFERLDDELGRIALCTLASMNWGRFKHPHEMKRACRLVVRALSNVLSYQDFLSIQSKLANDEFRPLGVGVTNLAYWHAKRGLKYGDPDALTEVKNWIEHQTFYLTEASVDLAEERGACELSHTTCYGNGIFPWEKRADGVNELTDFAPAINWEPLRAKMLQYGIHNATLGAIAPVESSSVAINSTNGIALPQHLIADKESKAGSFTQVVPEYKKLGSAYQLMWEQTDCVGYLKTAAVLSAYIDQAISTDTFYSPKHFEDGKIPITLIAKNLMLAHHWGLPSLYYSLMDKQGSKQSLEPTEDYSEDEECSACVL